MYSNHSEVLPTQFNGTNENDVSDALFVWKKRIYVAMSKLPLQFFSLENIRYLLYLTQDIWSFLFTWPLSSQSAKINLWRVCNDIPPLVSTHHPQETTTVYYTWSTKWGDSEWEKFQRKTHLQKRKKYTWKNCFFHTRHLNISCYLLQRTMADVCCVEQSDLQLIDADHQKKSSQAKWQNDFKLLWEDERLIETRINTASWAGWS